MTKCKPRTKQQQAAFRKFKALQWKIEAGTSRMITAIARRLAAQDRAM